MGRLVLISICILFMIGSHPVLGSAVTDSLQKELATAKADTTKVGILIQLSRKSVESPANALMYAKQAYEISRKSGFTEGEMKSNMQIGYVYFNKGSYKESLYYYFTVLRLKELSKDSSNLATALNRIGLAYFRLKKYNEALYYFNKTLQVVELRKNKFTHDILAGCVNNIGLILQSRNQYSQCISHFTNILERFPHLHDTTRAVIMGNLGNAYTMDKQYDEGLKITFEALQLMRPYISSQFTYIFMAVCQHNLGEAYLLKHKFDSSEIFLTNAIRIGEQHHLKEIQHECYAMFSKLYEAKGNYRKSLFFQRKAHAIKDSLLTQELSNQITGIEAKYDSERKDQEIQLLKKDKEIAQKQTENIIAKRNATISVVVLVLLVVLVLARNLNLRQRVKHNTLQEEKNRVELQKQQVEKEMIKLLHENSEARFEILKSQINPHFLFNCFATLSSLITKNQSKARQFVIHFSGLFRSILTTRDQKTLPLEDEMTLVLNYIFLQEIRLQERLKVNVSIDETLKSRHIPPFSVQMSIENAIKHNSLPQDEHLCIDIYTESDSIVITNNFRPAQSEHPVSSVGQQNIVDRYTMLSDVLPSFMAKDNIYFVRLPLLNA